MKTRRTIFYLLALLIVVGAVGWTVITSTAASRAAQDLDNPNASDAEQAGTAIGVGLGFGLTTAPVLCGAAVFAAIFALLGWRNGAGLRAQKRHTELVAAVQQQHAIKAE